MVMVSLGVKRRLAVNHQSTYYWGLTKPKPGYVLDTSEIEYMPNAHSIEIDNQVIIKSCRHAYIAPVFVA